MTSQSAQSLKRLDTLQRLATQQEDSAARQLADALAKHANAQDRYAELMQYELEYTARSPVARGVQALSYQAGFVSKLRDAVRFQSERVESLAGDVELARLRWMGLHREVEKLEQLGVNAQRQIDVVENRRNARELDELAQRGWARQRALS